MKRVTVLTLIVVACVALAGCSTGWPRWFCRGDNCGNCTTYGEGVYSSSPGLLAPSYVAPPELPGPAHSVPMAAPGTP